MTQREYQDEEVVEGAADPSGNLEGITLNSELRREIERAVADLPADLRAAVVLRDVQQLSNAEAAVALGITVSSLKARLHRGRVLLRQCLERYMKAPG